MKKSFVLGFLLFVIVLSPFSFTAYAFNSAAHIYIAEHVFEKQNIDLYYGSIAPDLSLYVANPEKWPTAFMDTHWDYLDLSPYAWDLTERFFAKGWLTHNEFWGADYFAHVENPVGNNTCITEGPYKGYVIEKACLLSSETGIDPEFSHFAIETVIDLLLKKNDDNMLGLKLLSANSFRSWKDRNLLVKVFAWKERKTDWFTLAIAEWNFRNLVNRYAMALVLPYPQDKKALAQLGAQLAQEMYGITVSHEYVLSILEKAISLCNDYKEAVDFTIMGIKNKM